MCKSCHVVLVRACIRNIDVLERAVKRLGGALHRNKTTFNWWGRWVDDYHENDAAYNHGVRPEEYGKCDHCISFPDCTYEIGLVRQGEGYSLVFDFIQSKLRDRIGGKEAGKLLQAYAVEAAIEQARNNCQTFTENVLEDGTIQLRVQVQE
jgi:hypothetical protein